MTLQLAPHDVRLTHPVTNSCFTDGQRLEDTVEALQTEQQKVLPPMKFVEFKSFIWSRSNRRLWCYRTAGTQCLIEGKHFEMHLPDRHFFGGLNAGYFFAIQEDDNETTFCGLCEKDLESRRAYVVLAVAGSVVCASSVSKSRQLRVENPTQQLVHMSKSMVALCTLFVLHLSDRFPETQTTHRQTRWGNCYLGKPIAAEAPLGWRHWSRAKLKRSFHKLIQHN